MAERTIKVIMNGVTGRMGYRQHLVRSILAIRDAGGVSRRRDRVQVEPVLVGRSADKLSELAKKHGVADWTTDLDEALADTQRADLLRRPGHLGPQGRHPQGHRGRKAHLHREADRGVRSDGSTSSPRPRRPA